MADLYNLQLDDDELLQQDQDDSQQQQQQELDEEEEDREQLELPQALEDAERADDRRKRRQGDGGGGTPEAVDEELQEQQEQRGLDLEDVFKPATTSTTTDGVGAGAGSTTTASTSSMTYSQLKTLWTQELDSPELLPYDEETIESLIEALKRQEERIDDIQTYGTGGASSSSSSTGTGSFDLDALTVNLIRVDADRVKFVICSLLRERLRKLEQYPLYCQQQYADNRMSKDEMEYSKKYGSLLQNHLHRTVLDKFPQDAWKKLDSPEMIDSPDLDTYVFVRTKYDVVIDNSNNNGSSTPGGGDYQQHPKGSCLIVRYSRIRNLFLEDKVELLV